MRDVVRRRELAEFLRSRRDRLTPADVGLLSIGRRKTPGLRREEVADLAGLGLAWYTWLEQARSINVSEQVLNALARALQLNSDERSYLLVLGQQTPRAHNADGEPTCVSEDHLSVLAALDPSPAHIRDGHWNVVAWNPTFAAATGVDKLPPQERNLLWMTFTDSRARRLQGNWPEMGAVAVAQFRFECSRRLEDPELVHLVDQLREVSPDFARLWRKHEVHSGIGTTATWQHPAGIMVFDRVMYPIDSSHEPGFVHGPRQRLGIYIPKPGTHTQDVLADVVGAA